jgi:peptidoglycan-associated lipoprotein
MTEDASHSLKDAFFDYDQFNLRDDARAALVEDANWLKTYPAIKIKVVGHADERGTAEYNLALGQHRAQAVEDYLKSLGVAPNRIEITSLGKEAPFCTGENESCWSQNRRGHFIVTAK